VEKSYWYVIGQRRVFRYLFRKDILVSDGEDASKSEHEIMLGRKIVRIFGAGTIRFEYVKRETDYVISLDK
jgi:hypothetical protein